MADFYWKGVQHGKYADGSITAINKDEAAYLLRQDKVIITSLELISGKEVKKEKQKPETPKNQKAKSVPIKEVIVFTKKLETMMRSGLPVLFRPTAMPAERKPRGKVTATASSFDRA